MYHCPIFLFLKRKELLIPHKTSLNSKTAMAKTSLTLLSTFFHHRFHLNVCFASSVTSHVRKDSLHVYQQDVDLSSELAAFCGLRKGKRTCPRWKRAELTVVLTQRTAGHVEAEKDGRKDESSSSRCVSLLRRTKLSLLWQGSVSKTVCVKTRLTFQKLLLEFNNCNIHTTPVTL